MPIYCYQFLTVLLVDRRSTAVIIVLLTTWHLPRSWQLDETQFDNAVVIQEYVHEAPLMFGWYYNCDVTLMS